MTREVIKSYSAIDSFLQSREIINISSLESKWRKENIILKVECKHGDYVLKVISASDKIDEIERVKLMSSYYPSITTKVHLYERNAYLMDFIPGKNFFDLSKKEKVNKIRIAGMLLKNCWNGRDFPKKDISEKIKASFLKYRRKAAQYFSPSELWLEDFSSFSSVPQQPSHSDLNAANLIYEEGIKIIDPSNEGYEDTARDIGRYLASCFFNNYDYFGENKNHSLDVASAFLSNFSEEMQDRAKFYTGESFLSFMNFPTRSTGKDILKKLAINTLTGDSIMKSLEESL